MATTNNITTTYGGEASRSFISAALLSSPTIYGGNVEVMPNVKFQHVMRRFEAESIVKDATCDFTDEGTLTTVERILAPKELQVNLNLCKSSFVDTWDAIQMGYSAHDNLPPNFAAYLVQYVAKKAAADNEVSIWSGSSAISGQFDGFTTLMATDVDVIDADNGNETAFTKDNIVSLFENVLDSVPSALYAKEDLKIYVPQVAWQAYIRSLNGFGSQGAGAAGYESKGSQWYNLGSALSFEGYEIVLAPGMPSDHIVAAQKSNLMFGTGLFGDHNDVRVIDTAATLGDKNVRVVMRYTAGVQYGISEECVLLTLA